MAKKVKRAQTKLNNHIKVITEEKNKIGEMAAQTPAEVEEGNKPSPELFQTPDTTVPIFYLN